MNERGKSDRPAVPANSPNKTVRALLANVYLHFVYDLWVDWWRRTRAHGQVMTVRFADDFIVGFEYEEDARRLLDELRERFAKFGLELHPDKTRLIEFGRHAARRRAARGLGKPETVDFLGFTHICAKSRSGWFWRERITISKRMRAKLRPTVAQCLARFIPYAGLGPRKRGGGGDRRALISGGKGRD